MERNIQSLENEALEWPRETYLDLQLSMSMSLQLHVTFCLLNDIRQIKLENYELQ